MAAPDFAYILILASALLHAGVNLLVKTSDDGIITRGVMNASAFCFVLPFLPFLPFPDHATLLLLMLSTLIHLLYPFLLVAAYRSGDLGVAYALARGFTPLMVATLGAVFASHYPDARTLAGISLVSAGICALALSSGRSRTHTARSAGFAALTALIVAAYTLVDAAGVRAAAAPSIYIGWLFAMDGACVAITVALLKRRLVLDFLRRHWKVSLLGGAGGTASYGLALVALGKGDVPTIAALRETSVLFAALLGVFVLKEPFPLRRISAVAIVLAGMIVIYH